MNDSVKLYVDSPLGFFNSTDKPDKIKFNCNSIDPQIIKDIGSMLTDGNPITAVIPVGKFVCIITVSVDESTQAMIFLDLDNNDDELYKALERMRDQDTEIRTDIISVFMEIRNNKCFDSEQYVLVEGEPLF